MFSNTPNIQLVYFRENQIEKVGPETFKNCQNIILTEIQSKYILGLTNVDYT